MQAESALDQPGPGVRRMCIAVSAQAPGLLAAACRAREFDRLYVSPNRVGGVELAVAPPGVDEAGLVHGLVDVMRRQVASVRSITTPILVAVHVGIIRIVDDRFGGIGVEVVRGLARHSAVLDAAAGDRPRLTVVMSDGLFADLHAEGLVGGGWQHVPAVPAWLQSFDPLPQDDGEPL